MPPLRCHYDHSTRGGNRHAKRSHQVWRLGTGWRYAQARWVGEAQQRFRWKRSFAKIRITPLLTRWCIIALLWGEEAEGDRRINAAWIVLDCYIVSIITSDY